MNGIPKANVSQDSPSSEEKMDTGSESFTSKHDTPNSISSDFDSEPEVLRLQNPENPILRLIRSQNDSQLNDSLVTNCQLNDSQLNDSLVRNYQLNDCQLNDSLVTKMCGLRLDSLDLPDANSEQAKKSSSMLTTTTDHPLMGLASPDSVENYPDVVPKKVVKEDLSLSSIEDDKNELNLNNFLEGPQRNTSKNNLYFSEHFTTAPECMLETSDPKSPPDITKTKRRRIPCLKDSSTPLPKAVDADDEVAGIQDLALQDEEFHSGVAEWCESPSQLRGLPNFELPIEMRSGMDFKDDERGTPDLLSSSTQEDRSLYQATADPCSGKVALHPRPPAQRARRRVVVPEDSCSLDSVSVLSSDDEEVPDDEPPPAEEPKVLDDDGGADDNLNSISEYSDPIPEYSAAEEFAEERAWLKVPLADGSTSTCDMKVIEPYKRVLSHGGYTNGGCAILVLSACHLPPASRPDYNYVMTHLFLYVLWSVERLVTEHYALVYLGGAAKRSLPTWRWLRECYTLVDRRLRKNLKHLYLVHPTFWLKSIVILCKPFISSKFMKKISYVKNLSELRERLPVEPNAIPDLVKEYDASL